MSRHQPMQAPTTGSGQHVQFTGSRGVNAAVQPEVTIPRRGIPAPKSILTDEIRFLIPNVYDPWLPLLRQRPHEAPGTRTADPRPFPQ